MAVKSFRDLRVWHAAMDLVERVYRLIRTFPRYEVYGLANQLQRAAVSIPSNIAEGHTRQHNKEYVQYLSLAQASISELETQLEIATRPKYVSPQELAHVLEQSTSLGRQLYALRDALLKRRATLGVVRTPTSGP